MKMKMMNKSIDKRQRSIIAGGLASSAGIFLSKAIGILYVSPFQALATDANIAYYSYGYTLYDIALQLAVAGIPLAIAAIIAKYYVKKDIATVFLVRKIARNLMLFLGFLAMIFIFGFATPLARIIVTDNVSETSIYYTANVLKIISVAMIVTPLLGSYRSIFQGLKYMEVFAFSQVIEQFVRVGFLLLVGYLLVSVLGFDPMWAVYVAIAAASVAGIVAIVHLHIKEKGILALLKAEQTTDIPSISIKEVFKEIFYFSIPFMIISLLGKSTAFVNLLFFNRAMFMITNDGELIKLLYGMIMFNTSKLTSIPQVLAIGFSSAVIPYISESMNTKNMKQLKKNIFDAIDTVLYFSIPLSAGLMFFAAPIYYLFFTTNATLGGQVLFYVSSGGMILALTPVTTSIMLLTRLRKKAIVVLAISFAINLALIFPLILTIGYPGAIYASYIAHIFVIIANLRHLSKQYKLSYKGLIRRSIIMLLSMSVFYFSYQLSILIGINYTEIHKLFTLLYIVIFGGIGLVLYVAITWFFQIPQTIFNVNSMKDITKRK